MYNWKEYEYNGEVEHDPHTVGTMCKISNECK